jgi:hypothetical protein
MTAAILITAAGAVAVQAAVAPVPNGDLIHYI